MLLPRTKSGGSKMPQWQTDELQNMTSELDGTLSNLGCELATGSYNMSETLLSLPSLTVFKQEAVSPSQDFSTVAQAKVHKTCDNSQDHNSALHRLLQTNNYNNSLKQNTLNSQNKICETNEKKTEDFRFQYVLAAATSMATKVTEETLTYLNQGQSYEIKLKKVGELSNFRGKILKSVIKICFHERRLQYMENERILAWQASRPGERIVELDIPLSYGLFDAEQGSMLNTLSFLWDPTKEVGAYIKVNCISTEFTPKKHGGEKGVPFRIQVETYIDGESNRLHAAACQIKVFKLKGADRKHKQDREKIMRRPLSEQDMYQPSYECTVLNDLIPEEISPSTNCLFLQTSTIPATVAPAFPNQSQSDSSLIPHDQAIAEANSSGKQNGIDIETRSAPRKLSFIPLSHERLSSEFNCQQTGEWLRKNNFESYTNIFANFNGVDILRMSRDDLILICGLADGIRLHHVLNSKHEMCQKLAALLGIHQNEIQDVFLYGPSEIRVLVTDEVVNNIKDESVFAVEVLRDETQSRFILLLKPSCQPT